MNAVRVALLGLLITLCAGTLLLSQLDNGTTDKIYGSVSRMLNIDLKALRIDTIQISNGGHIAAGFVLCGLAQLIMRRWWALPLVMFFFSVWKLRRYFPRSGKQGGLM